VCAEVANNNNKPLNNFYVEMHAACSSSHIVQIERQRSTVLFQVLKQLVPASKARLAVHALKLRRRRRRRSAAARLSLPKIVEHFSSGRHVAG
jgi:hypothetical protein